jgi:hypothetical protein
MKYNCSFLLKHPDRENRTDTLSWNGTKPTYTTAKALETPPTPKQKP